MDRESIIGSLLAHAVGDALGFVVEGYGPKICTDYVDTVLRKQLFPVMKRLPQFRFGQYTDDTQLAREFLVSVLQTKGTVDVNFSPAVYATRIAMMFMPNAYRIVGYGRQTARGAEAVRMGAHHTESGCKAGHGNGSCMRSGPIGLVFKHDVPAAHVAEVARVMSAITHASTQCMDTAVAIALSTRYMSMTRKAPFDVKGLFAYITPHIRDALYLDGLRIVDHLLETRAVASTVAATVIRIGTELGETPWDGISAGATQSSLWSIWCACRFPDSFIDCVCEAIAVGGDVDTTAAMAGQMIGARVTRAGIPKHWVDQLHDIDEWTADDLVALAGKVHDLTSRPCMAA